MNGVIEMTSIEDLREFVKLTAETVDLKSAVEMEKLRGEVKESNAKTETKLTEEMGKLRVEVKECNAKTETKLTELASKVTASAITKGQWIKIIGLFVSAIASAFGISKI
jgi:menaquinone-dependent protoporphyrinogen IX oxidase